MRNWIRLVELAGQGHLPFTADGMLYHTSDNAGAHEILKTRTIRPGTNHEGGAAYAYVSMSEIPLLGNLQIGSAADVCIGFHAAAFAGQLDPVEYSVRWYKENPERAAYVAGEGWYHQWEPPEDAYDDEGFEDEEVYNAAHSDAEFSAFMHKEDEREWISHQPGEAVSFKPDAVVVLITADINDWHETLALLGYGHVKVRTK